MIGGNVLLKYSNILIPVKKCHESAVLPIQAAGDVGFDLSCVEDVTLLPGKTTKVSTGLMFAESIEPLIIDNKISAVPFMKIEGRSGMAANGIFPVGGILDPRYRGEIIVVLYNSTDSIVSYKCGSRIAQMVCYYTLATVSAHLNVKLIEVSETSESSRGSNGFGSTGI